MSETKTYGVSMSDFRIFPGPTAEQIAKTGVGTMAEVALARDLLAAQARIGELERERAALCVGRRGEDGEYIHSPLEELQIEVIDSRKIIAELETKVANVREAYAKMRMWQRDFGDEDTPLDAYEACADELESALATPSK